MPTASLNAPAPRTPDAPTPPAVRGALVEVVPVLVAIAPLGWALGAATAASPLDGPVGWAGGPLLVSGAAHFALVSAYAGGAGALAAAVTALVIAGRGLVYSAALAGPLGGQPRWFRALAAYLLVDQMYVLTDGWLRRGTRGASLRRAYLAAGAALWLTWVAAIAAGMLAGPVVPAGWHVELVLGALLAGMLTGAVRGRAAMAAAVAAAAAAVAGTPLPAGLGVMAATLTGVLAAALTDRGRR